MARIVRAQGLVQIWSETVNGQKALVGYSQDGNAGYRGLTLYEAGNGVTYTSNYQLGCSPAKARVFNETPQELAQAFKRAGLPAPRIVRVPFGRRVYRALHAMHRLSTGVDRRAGIPNQQIR